MNRRSFFFSLFLITAVALYSWETAIAGVLTTPPAQGQDNRVYSTADDRALHCLDAETGKEYWNFRTGRRLSGFTVVSPDHSILIQTVQNLLICVSPGGRLLWQFQLDAPPALPPAVDPYGFIYLLKNPFTLIGIDRSGHALWEYNTKFKVEELFVLNSKILLIGVQKTEVLNTDGSYAGEINSAPVHLLIKDTTVYWESSQGSFSFLNQDSLELDAVASPLPEGTLYPEPEILITYQNKIISGRKDWFLEAVEEGEMSFYPYYQWGCNPGRTRGFVELPGTALRIARFSERKGFPLLPLMVIDNQYLEQILKQFEKADSLPSVLKIDPDYDLLFQEILSDSHVVSFDVYRPRLDEYSRYRIYRILSRWGNLNSRETLLFLSKAEESPQNMILIMEGLGKIGLDADHRSMTSIVKMTDHFPRNERVIAAAVRNAALLAKYNGGRSVLDMMDLFTALQQKELSNSNLKLIHEELNSF